VTAIGLRGGRDVSPSPTILPVEPRPRLGHVDLLTVGEIAAELRVSRTTVRRLIRGGELRAHALGAEYRVTRENFDAYLTDARS